jgi:DNA-binding HxlR family transcriptional regulator
LEILNEELKCIARQCLTKLCRTLEKENHIKTENRIIMHLYYKINPLKEKLNPFCHLLALLGAEHILHVSRVRVKLLSKAVYC